MWHMEFRNVIVDYLCLSSHGAQRRSELNAGLLLIQSSVYFDQGMRVNPMATGQGETNGLCKGHIFHLCLSGTKL